jgi:uroporphyrin-III C-methyltransferase/precorrin-2 dehydrogenase/sirohydrochlorin ferrochelatase
MDYFPVFLKLEDQAVLVLGGGNVAERKIRMLLAARATVRVVAHQLNEACSRWAQDGQIHHIARQYSSDQLAGVRLVFAASDDVELNNRVYRDAESAGVLVNVVDQPESCRFISPAVIDRSPVQIAVSTGGKAPALARRLRTLLEAQLPLELGPLAAAAGAVRRLVAKLVPASRRRAFWDRQFSIERLHEHTGKTRSQLARQLIAAARGGTGPASGKVYLVGGGPGRPDLLTLRALQLLGQADVILHDQLLPEAVIALARRDADRVDVGKRAGRHRVSQAQINELLVQHARAGKTVVRLKGGDPFVFGRGGEELEVLRAHGIAYEVVPGITAAVACGAYSGIPLTHREHAGIVSFVTAHAARDSAVDWATLAGPGRTLAIYMGLGQARQIRERLLAAGVAATTPAALVSAGTTDRQNTVIATIAGLPDMAARVSDRAPGLFIIGQVAGLGGNLSWFNVPETLAKAA